MKHCWYVKIFMISSCAPRHQVSSIACTVTDTRKSRYFLGRSRPIKNGIFAEQASNGKDFQYFLSDRLMKNRVLSAREWHCLEFHTWWAWNTELKLLRQRCFRLVIFPCIGVCNMSVYEASDVSKCWDCEWEEWVSSKQERFRFKGSLDFSEHWRSLTCVIQDIEWSLCRYVHINIHLLRVFFVVFHRRRFFLAFLLLLVVDILRRVFFSSPSIWKIKLKACTGCASFHLSHWNIFLFDSIRCFFKKMLFWRRIKNNFCYNNANAFFIVRAIRWASFLIAFYE